MAKPSDPNRVTVRLEDDEREELEAFAKRIGESKSEVIRVALRLGLAELVEDPKKMLTPPQSRLKALDAAKKSPTKRPSRD